MVVNGSMKLGKGHYHNEKIRTFLWYHWYAVSNMLYNGGHFYDNTDYPNIVYNKILKITWLCIINVFEYLLHESIK